LPSSQDVPSAFAGLLHTPVLAAQVPASWHWSLAVHCTGLLPVQFPAEQASVCVQALPSLHAVPLDFALQAVWLVVGVHCWHWLLGLPAPAA
jgi:hypothetical protein